MTYILFTRHPDKCPECADEYVKIKTAHENIQKYGELYKIKRAINLKTTKFPSMKSPRTKDELWEYNQSNSILVVNKWFVFKLRFQSVFKLLWVI